MYLNCNVNQLKFIFLRIPCNQQPIINFPSPCHGNHPYTDNKLWRQQLSFKNIFLKINNFFFDVIKLFLHIDIKNNFLKYKINILKNSHCHNYKHLEY